MFKRLIAIIWFLPAYLIGVVVMITGITVCVISALPYWVMTGNGIITDTKFMTCLVDLTGKVSGMDRIDDVFNGRVYGSN